MKSAKKYILFYFFSALFFSFAFFHPPFSFADNTSCASLGLGTCENFSNNCDTSSCSSTNTEICTGTCSGGNFACQISKSCAAPIQQTCANPATVSCPGYAVQYPCPGDEICTDSNSCGGQCYTPVCLAGQSTETGCPSPSNGCIYEAFCDTSANPPTYKYPCQQVCPATPTPLPSTPTPTPSSWVCTPGAFNTFCLNENGGCTNANGTTDCAEQIQQCDSNHQWQNAYDVCSNGTCTSCLGNITTPTPPIPPPAASCQCKYDQQCTDANGNTGVQTCSGINSGTSCVWDSSGSCQPNCSACTSPTGPPPVQPPKPPNTQCYFPELSNIYTINSCQVKITHIGYQNNTPVSGNYYRQDGFGGNTTYSRGIQWNGGQDCDPSNGVGCETWQYNSNDTSQNDPHKADAESAQGKHSIMNFNNNWSASAATKNKLIMTTSIDLDTNGQLNQDHPGYKLDTSSCFINNCGQTHLDVPTSLTTQQWDGVYGGCKFTPQTPDTKSFNLIYCGNGVCECGEQGTNPSAANYCPVDCGPNVTLLPTPTPVPLYSVSGDVFADANSNGRFDSGEGYGGATVNITVNITNGSATFAPKTTLSIGNGDYNFTNLPAGNYTVSLNPVPTNYTAIPPTSYSITVGSSGCKPSSLCTNGSISRLNFGITNHIAWFQGTGGDMRMDDFKDPIPSPVPPNYVSLPGGSGGTSGNVFANNANTYDFCSGAGEGGRCPQNASSADWLVTGQFFKATSSIPTYESVTSQNIQTPKSLPQDCDTTGCTISSLTHGYYQDANSTGVTLNSLTLSSGTAVIAIKGDLHINGNINASGGTLIFLVHGKIYVGSNVGAGTVNYNDVCSPASPDKCQIQGFYVADSSFQINSAAGSSGKCNTDGSPVDKRLNILGAVVANATGGGSFVQNRDLCNQDPNYPAVSIIEDPDMILNLPPFVSQSNNIWQEVAP